MSDAEAPSSPSAASVPAPVLVEYDQITGVPAEFNQYLPKDSEEYKRWKAAQAGPEALAALTLKDKAGNEIERQLPGGKVKKKQKPQIVLEASTRNKKKSITSVVGLELFGIKLAEASKTFGKKFATGASVTKLASGGEQIEMQGDFVDALAELILSKYGASNGIGKDAVYVRVDKKVQPYFDDDDDDSEG